MGRHGAAANAAANNRANQMNPNHSSYQARKTSSATLTTAAANNRANQLNPNHPSYQAARGTNSTKPATAAANNRTRSTNPTVAAASNHANQMNPNHPAYWQTRGAAQRPADFESESKKRAASGEFEYRANAAAAKDQALRAAEGAAMRRVEAAAKSALGGQAQVLRAGSQKKHTDVASRSDLDVVVKAPEPLTREAQRALGGALAAQFPESRVVTRKYIHQVQTKDIKVDVVPHQATYQPQTGKLPTDRFKNNPKGRDAVRNLKTYAKEHGLVWKGDQLEKTVLEVQKLNKGADGPRVFELAKARLLRAGEAPDLGRYDA